MLNCHNVFSVDVHTFFVLICSVDFVLFFHNNHILSYLSQSTQSALRLSSLAFLRQGPFTKVILTPFYCIIVVPPFQTCLLFNRDWKAKVYIWDVFQWELVREDEKVACEIEGWWKNFSSEFVSSLYKRFSTLVRQLFFRESVREQTSDSLYNSFLKSRVLVKQEQELMRTDSESLYESFLNSHVLVKREQELHKSWWELTSESFYESFLNSHALVKREQEFYESWEVGICMSVFSTLMSNENKNCMRGKKLLRVFSDLIISDLISI